MDSPETFRYCRQEQLDELAQRLEAEFKQPTLDQYAFACVFRAYCNLQIERLDDKEEWLKQKGT